MRKKTFLLFLTILFAFAVHAIDTLKVDSKIKEVIVFFDGAQIHREANVSVVVGKTQILLSGLPADLNKNSIQVSGFQNATILSVKHFIASSLGNNKDKFLKNERENIKSKSKGINNLKAQIKVFEQEEKLLLDNMNIGEVKTGSKTTELREAANFYRQRLNEISSSKITLNQKIEILVDSIKNSNSRINKIEAQKQKQESQIVITIESQKKTDEKMIISYFVKSARWEPMYDFRVNEINEPLSLGFLANVYQTTGEDWKQVQLTLSVSSPSSGGEKPELRTWYPYQSQQIVYYKKDESTSSNFGSIKGKVFDEETHEPIPFANVLLMQNGNQINGTTTDLNGLYVIKPIKNGNYQLTVSCVGYQTYQSIISVSSNTISFLNVPLLSSAISLEEVQIIDYTYPLIDKDLSSSGEEIRKMPGRSSNSVATTIAGVYSENAEIGTIHGSRNSGNVTYVDGIKIVPSNEIKYINNRINSKVLNVEYKINVPYTILSDGDDNQIKIKDIKVPVEYVFYAVPKADKDAFLVANITNWNELNLLSGKSSIYYQGTFVGESYIDTDNLSDTLQVSLGRDKNILVQRTNIKEKTDQKILGNSVKYNFAWNISVKNNKSTTAKIIIEDQYPVSEIKSVEIFLEELEMVKNNKKTGKLTWEFILQAGEKKEFNYFYSIRSPKNIQLFFD